MPSVTGARFAPVKLAVLAAVAALALSGCGGIRGPHLPNFGGGKKAEDAGKKLKGKRIAVLSLNDKLEPNDALKGIGFQLPAAQPRTDWPQQGGDPNHAVEHVAAAPDLRIAWRRRIGRKVGFGDHVTSQPILADGRLYVMDGEAGVSALDPASGREIWRENLAPRKGPDREAYGGGLAYAEGQVFVSSGYRFVAALDAKTGAVKWRKDTANPVHGAPTVADGRVYTVDVEDQLLTYAAADGTEGWTYQALQEPARMLRASSPAVDGQTVVSPFASGELVALNAANGSELWSYVLSLTNRNNALSEIRDISGRPVIYRGDVLAGSHSGVFAAVDLRTGQPRWSLPIATTTSPWPAGDVVYITDQAGEVVCVSREAGQVYWIVELNAGLKAKKRALWSGPVLVSASWWSATRASSARSIRTPGPPRPR